jgi:hypothetical protein
VARVRDSSRGILIAALIVAANFVVVLQITGISYGRFQWVEFASAYDPTQTPTPTATATPTRTPLPDGAGCSAGPDCASTFCVDGVCCNSACDQPGEACDIPGRQGICAVPAPAPALSSGALAAAVALLLAIGALALRATRRRDRTAR